MSGFVTLIPSRGASVDEGTLGRLTGALRYRGPDGSGLWTNGAVGLGHAWLQTAPESERQPLSFEGQVWIVAEARLDGRDELLRSLRRYGTVPDEAPDVALVLHAYHAWGEACLDHLRGDFSFALWDERRGRLFCARDPLGRGTLYYAETDGGLVLSNTLNVLRLHPDVPDRLNPQAVGDYLLTGYNGDLETTFFAGIEQLPPAHALTWQAGALHRRRYWSVPEPEDFLLLDRPEDYPARFHELLTRAVADRIRTDRVVLTLSGGMDSTTVAVGACDAVAQGRSRAVLTAYTFGFEWLLPDTECYYAGLVARDLDLPIHYFKAEDFLLVDAVDDAWMLMAEPSFPLRKVPIVSLYDRIGTSQGLVALSGLGGDPLLAPHWSYAEARLRQAGAGGVLRLGRHHVRLFGRPALGLRELRQRRAYGRRSWVPQVPLPPLNPDFVAACGLDTRWQQVLATAGAGDTPVGMATHPFWVAMRAASQPGFAGHLTELRHPFFDTRLLEFVLRLPPMPWVNRKHIMRDAMRGRLPEAVRRRRKEPLAGNPLYELAARGYEPWLEDLVSVPELAAYVDQQAIRALAKCPADLSVQQYHSSVLMPASLGYWLRNRARLLDAPRRASGGQAVPSVVPIDASVSV